MKHFYWMLPLMITALAVPAWSGGPNASPSAVAVDQITAYYASMAEMTSGSVSVDLDPAEKKYTAMHTYLVKNRDRLITHVRETRSDSDLDHALQAVNRLYKSESAYHAYGKSSFKAAADVYFDCATGHRYHKSGPDAYDEYTRTGRYLKTVPADLPLLTRSRNVHPICDGDYILYQKSRAGKTDYLTLPGCENHPDGWKAEKLMVSLN